MNQFPLKQYLDKEIAFHGFIFIRDSFGQTDNVAIDRNKGQSSPSFNCQASANVITKQLDFLKEHRQLNQFA